MDGIFQEISQDIKKDKLNAFMKRYGILVIIFFVVLFCSVGFWFWWQDHKEKQILEEAEIFNQVLTKLQSQDNHGAYEKLEKLAYGNTIYAQMASLQVAGISLNSQNYNKAIAEYNALIENDKVDKVIKDYAKLMLIKTEYISNKINDDEMLSQITHYIHDSSYFKSQAKFLRATVFIKLDKIDKAKQDLNVIITDTSLPPSFINICEILEKSLR